MVDSMRRHAHPEMVLQKWEVFRTFPSGATA